MEGAIQALALADRIVGHNVIKFDIPLIKKLYPWFDIDQANVRDTLVCTRLIWPDIGERDAAKGRALGKLTGSHSLKAWGLRMGNHKGDYEGGWEKWSPDMQKYCEQDVEVTCDLYRAILEQDYAETSLELEHQVAWIIAKQERNGFLFDADKAAALYSVLVKRKLEMDSTLQTLFDPWWSKGDVINPPKTLTYKKNPLQASRTAGAEFTEVKLNLFNPSSRRHIADRLINVRGWKPTIFTDKGTPKIDEETMGKLKYPEAKMLTEYFLVEKRIGQLAEGPQAWLKKVGDDGRIHGSVNTNGAITGRATHSHPNIAQVPSCGAPYGPACRELFKVSQGNKLVGIDVSGLELRMLGHYMARFDDGVYAKEVINGDVHTANKEAAGLTSRDEAKRFIYAFLYGAGPEKLASVTGRKTRSQGKLIKDQFLAKTPALAKLIDRVQTAAKEKKFLTGLDGRKLHVRSPHAALNTLLQSAGALVCKQWIVTFDRMLEDAGFLDQAKLVAWVHDEIQLEVGEQWAEEVGLIAIDAIAKAGEHFNLRVPLTGEYKIGNNWKETH
jgi:DNA polymerase I-like protein with 3'-5' exonuclease and polymerase domains